MKLRWLIPDGDLAWYNPVQKSWQISNKHTESPPLLRVWVVIKNLHLLQWETLQLWLLTSGTRVWWVRAHSSNTASCKGGDAKAARFPLQIFGNVVWDVSPGSDKTQVWWLGSCWARRWGDPAPSHWVFSAMLCKDPQYKNWEWNPLSFRESVLASDWSASCECSSKQQRGNFAALQVPTSNTEIETLKKAHLFAAVIPMFPSGQAQFCFLAFQEQVLS